MSINVQHMALVIADISGYTRFTKYHSMALLHAEQIISDLIEAVIDSSDHPLKVNKLEGDAVFFYAESRGDNYALCAAVKTQAVKFFEAFQAKAEEVLRNPVCWCSACQNAGELHLKVVAHFGEVAMKKVKTFEELAGEPVIRLYRLLKNSLKSSEYFMMTNEFHRLAGDVGDMRRESRTENAEGIGAVSVQVFYPQGQILADVSAAPKAGWGKRLAQYWRVNWYAILRFFRLRPKQTFAHLPYKTAQTTQTVELPKV